jgi:hypothetical protein
MHCANPTTTPDLDFIYSYDKPAAPLSGSIVFLPGSGGTLGKLVGDGQFVQDYFNDSYEVIQVAWQTDWQQTSDPLALMTAAGRPAGFLNYVLNTPLLNARSTIPTAGLCAQAVSAGSGGAGYALAWYADSAGNYLNADLDNVELMSGPVFANVEAGCMVISPSLTAAQTICPAGQYGCSPGTTTWQNPEPYVPVDAQQVRAWTNDNTCANAMQTSSTSNQNWLAMSIVNGSGGNFTYSNLGMAGWVCATSTSCSLPNCPNNSAAEGEFFYTLFTSGSHPAGYKLTGITSCENAEGVAQGTDPDTGQPGWKAIEGHMTTQCTHPSPR